MSEWQPIETAPKDGTVIDVWRARCWTPFRLPSGMMHGEWVEARRLANVYWIGKGIEYDCTVNPTCQRDASGWAEFKMMLAHSQPSITHWMSIPTAPKIGGAE